MKLTILAVLLALLPLIRADVPGTFLNRTETQRMTATYSEPQQLCDGQRFFSTCAAGMCEAVQVCLGPSTEYRYCGFVNPDKPFCNKGECSDVPDFSGGCAPNQLRCTGEGWFPDPHVCSISHYCEGINQLSDVAECPAGFVFNPVTTMCKKKQSDADCIRVKCAANQVLVTYGDSKRYFAFCQMESGMSMTNIRMYQCPEGTEFNGKSCVFRCTEVGRVPIVGNPSAYYLCYEVGEEADIEFCSVGKIFDPVKQVCVLAPLA